MKTKVSVFLIIFFMMMLVGCGVDSQIISEPTTEGEKGEELERAETSTDDEYPLPILEGWEEIEVTFETIGSGNIDVWHGEFSFEDEIEDYFDTYQAALIEEGFEVEITQDTEGMKSLSFNKVIDGEKRVGNALFTQNWVKSSLQHFK